jgi:hypothetical protein
LIDILKNGKPTDLHYILDIPFFEMPWIYFLKIKYLLGIRRKKGKKTRACLTVGKDHV